MSQLAFDNFTRTDSTGLGANWTVVPGEGTFDIVSNKAVCHDRLLDSCMFYNVPWPDDQYSEVIIGTVGTTDVAGIGCLVRASSTVRTYYRAFSSGTPAKAYVMRRIAGTGLQLGTSSTPVVTGDRMRLSVQGTTITLAINGTNLITVIDANIPSGSAGIHYSSADSVVDSLSFWSGGNLVQPILMGGICL